MFTKYKKNSFIGITIGDPGGIGPEIAVKAAEYFLKRSSRINPVIFGSAEHVLNVSKNIVKIDNRVKVLDIKSSLEESYDHTCINVLDLSSKSYEKVRFGVSNPKYAKEVELFISTAVDFAAKGNILGFATAPINKDMMLDGGARFGGHTELLGFLRSSDDFVMLFYSKKMITSLATIHVPLRIVADLISKELLRKILNISVNSIRKDFGKKNPKIAILGLNPHAGENGKIGIEENEIIIPVIKEFNAKRFAVDGPFPADSFFASKYREYDLIVAMYHDQALIPFKLLSFGSGVNVTVGLDIIRTSPVHGTAYEIAGKNIADASSMIESIKLAYTIAKNRK